MACLVSKHFVSKHVTDGYLNSYTVQESKIQSTFITPNESRDAQWQMLYVKSEFSVQVYCEVNKVMRKSFEEFGRSTLTD